MISLHLVFFFCVLFCVLVLILVHVLLLVLFLVLLLLLPGVKEVPQPASPCELRLDDQDRGGDVREGRTAGRDQV